MRDEIMAVKKELEEVKGQYNVNNNINSNFDLGNEFRKIIYFLFIIIIVLLGIIIFFVIKNNNMAKELSQYSCETDIMEQDGVYNFIDSEGNMITTDSDVLEEFIKEYYNGKTEKND